MGLPSLGRGRAQERPAAFQQVPAIASVLRWADPTSRT